MILDFFRRRKQAKSLTLRERALDVRAQMLNKQKQDWVVEWRRKEKCIADSLSKLNADRASFDTEKQKVSTEIAALKSIALDEAREITDVRFNFEEWGAVSIERVEHGTNGERTMIAFTKNLPPKSDTSPKHQYFSVFCSRAQHQKLVAEYDEYQSSKPVSRKKK